MKSYGPYVKSLKKLVFTGFDDNSAQDFEPVLNGQPYAELRSCITIQERRACGAFFTDHELADSLIKPLSKKLAFGEKILDPACGTGNLLLACTKYLPLKNTIGRTIDYWGKLIHGYDIHNEFVETTKLRLLVMAIQRHSISKPPVFSLDDVFPGVKVKDGLESDSDIKGISMVLLNPPYTKTKLAGNTCSWARGSTSAAALFVEHYIRFSENGICMAAILPDVLRTGSLYKKWRKYVTDNTKLRSLSINGLFDRWTDIDVFSVHLQVSRNRKITSTSRYINPWKTEFKEKKQCPDKLHDYFSVSVGAVVPHRLDGKGAWKAYLHAKNCPAGEVFNIDDMATNKIRFHGTVFKPPFVVIRRTSRPQEERRILATIIKGSRDVAVENHLIVLLPFSKTLMYCKKIADYLNSGEADEWLNQRLRCRHLTTCAIKDIPVPRF